MCVCYSEDAVNEIRVLASVRHANIVRYRDSFIENDRLFIVCFTLSPWQRALECVFNCFLYVVYR